MRSRRLPPHDAVPILAPDRNWGYADRVLIPAALAVLLAVSPARAVSIEEAQENVETIIQTHVAQKSPEGFWPVKQKGGGNLRLKLKSIDAKNARRASGEVFKVTATFTDEASQKPFYGEFDIDFGGMIWKVTRSRWVTRAQLDASLKNAKDDAAKETARAAEAAKAAETARAARAAKRAALPDGTATLPEVSLVAVGSLEPVALDACATPKCLTVYVAPWCPHCRNASANINTLRAFLKEKGIDTRIIVGNDTESEVEQYAESFGKGTLLDANKTFKFSGGVPHLFVSEDGGRILKDMAGFYEEPMPAAELAAALNLP